MAVLQEPETVLPGLGSFPRSHLKEEVWETEKENNHPIKKNHNIKWETFETNEDSLEDSGKGKKSTSCSADTHPLGLTDFFFFN